MSSTITNYSNSINVNFPIPGEDNDSQGFRSNFSKIQTALGIAGDEISDLQLNSVNLSDTNDFGNNIIKRAALQGASSVVNDAGSVTGVVTVDYAIGSYQQFTVTSGTTNFVFENWPDSTTDKKCGTIRIEITPDTTSDCTINFNGITDAVSRTSVNPVTYNTTASIVWDIWSPDGGTTLFATEVGSGGINVNSSGDIYGKAGTTSMTSGFFYIPSASGAPSGVPTAISGHVPMYYDTTNNRFYIYNGAWKKVSLT